MKSALHKWTRGENEDTEEGTRLDSLKKAKNAVRKRAFIGGA